MKYHVNVPMIFTMVLEVEADSPAEAAQLIENDEGLEVGRTNFSLTDGPFSIETEDGTKVWTWNDENEQWSLETIEG